MKKALKKKKTHEKGIKEKKKGMCFSASFLHRVNLTLQLKREIHTNKSESIGKGQWASDK